MVYNNHNDNEGLQNETQAPHAVTSTLSQKECKLAFVPATAGAVSLH